MKEQSSLSDLMAECGMLQGFFSTIHRNGAGGGRDTVTKAFCRSLSIDRVNRRFVTCDLEGRSSDEAVTNDAGLAVWPRRPDIRETPVGIVSPDGGGGA